MEKKTTQKESFEAHILRILKKKSFGKKEALLSAFIKARTMGDLRSIVATYSRKEIIEFFNDELGIMNAYVDGVGVSGDACYRMLRSIDSVGRRRCGLV